MNQRTPIPQVYDASNIETKWYEYWEKNGYFSPNPQRSNPFCMVIPPPNVTGFLHMGHALNLTLHDILTRYRRMKGDRTLWLPGTDHAGIATQNVVEKQLAKEGLDRHQVGRDEFIKLVWKWKDQYHDRIVKQLKSMGASCDWTRERFTLDEGLSAAVKEVFVQLFEEGLIYRGEYIVNWCPRCETALSDIEVEYRDLPSFLYYIRYPIKERPGQYLVVATTRPETMLGDVALAIHPDDKRYCQYVNATVILPIVGREMSIIQDEYVDPQFGTGVLKVTPAHDINDFELGKKHHLPAISVIDSHGVMSENAGAFAGMTREQGREAIVEKLKSLDLIDKIEEYSHSVGHCYRCNTPVEPLVSKQWFVKMKELAQPAIQAVEEGRVEFIPERWSKVYFEWMNNIRDWCISRQIWWGHRIPVFYCQECGYYFADRGQPEYCPQCKGRVIQDEDVLDTWFSSALWPFSTLGWPEVTDDLQTFYPTSVLITAFDIIFFWVARMIMMGLKFMKDVPFRKVYITPLVRDAYGKKMSKSLGNAIDPLEVARQLGSDSLRFALAWLTVQGRDIHLSMERIEASRNFMNKIWNASRFVLMNLDEDLVPVELNEGTELSLKDRWILSRFHRTIEQASLALDDFRFGEYVQMIYDFIWGEFCDWYIEWSKKDLYQGSPEVKRKTQSVLVTVLSGILKLLHPVAPFITEEIWHSLPVKNEAEAIIVSRWPVKEPRWLDERSEKIIDSIQKIIREIRFLRAELEISPAETGRVQLGFHQSQDRMTIEKHLGYIEQLAKCEIIKTDDDLTKPIGSVTGQIDGIDIFLMIEGLVEVDGELQRLNKKYNTFIEEIEIIKKRFVKPEFLEKAPPEVIEKDRIRLEKLLNEAQRLQKLIEGIREP